jgi:hypothetical protein
LSGVLGNLARTVLRGLLLSNGEWLLDKYESKRMIIGKRMPFLLGSMDSE